MLRGRAGSKILGAGRSGTVLKIFGFRAVWGSHFSRGWGGACIPATLFIYALVLQISKCREIHTFWCNLLASKTAAAEFYLTNIKSPPFVYLCVFAVRQVAGPCGAGALRQFAHPVCRLAGGAALCKIPPCRHRGGRTPEQPT